MLGGTASFDLRGLDEASDEYAISIAIDFAKHLLQSPCITARQIIGLGNALYALERLPIITLGANVEFGVVLSVNNESRYLSFLITSDIFEISRGGFIDLGAGYDSYSYSGWHIEVGGFREAECDLCLLEDEFLTLLGCGAKITVNDSSEIEHETENESCQSS